MISVKTKLGIGDHVSCPMCIEPLHKVPTYTYMQYKDNCLAREVCTIAKTECQRKTDQLGNYYNYISNQSVFQIPKCNTRNHSIHIQDHFPPTTLHPLKNVVHARRVSVHFSQHLIPVWFAVQRSRSNHPIPHR